MAVRAQPEPPDLHDNQSSLCPEIAVQRSARETFCISNSREHVVLQSGDHAFDHQVSRFYTSPESVVLEKLLLAKATIRHSRRNDSFWSKATELLSDLTGAQYAFISRRMDVDDDMNQTPLPPMGDPGSCLMGMSILYTDPKGDRQSWSNSKYLAYSSPCEHMRYNKVFLIPERMSEVVPNNQNQLPESPEGYLAVPLSSLAPGQGPSFGHFGVMWTQKGLDERLLSFSFLEMVLHSLEDVILQAFADQGLSTPMRSVMERVSFPSIVRQSSGKTPNSFKPFAPSLSHELRTPIQVSA
jgi:hypothetical protein